VLGQLVAQKSAQGEIVSYIGTITDITTRKQVQQQLQQCHQEVEAEVAERTAELTRINQQLQQEILEHQTTAKELQESHYLLKAVIDHVPDHIFVKDAEDRLVLVNPALANYLGQPLEALLGKQSDELFAPEVAARFRARDLRIISTAAAETFEESFSSPTGFLTTRFTTKLPWRNTNGEIIGIIGIARDISEAKRDEAVRIHTETALRESEERYRQLVELCPDAIFIQCNGKFIFLNSAAVQLYGGTCAEDLIGTFVLERVHPYYQALVQACLQQLQHQVAVPLIEQKLYRLDGTVVDVEASAISLTYQGEPAIQVVLRDITARKQAEAASRLTDFSFECSSIAATWIRPDASIARVNKAACQILGYSREELQSMHVYEVDPNFPAEAWPEHWQALKQHKHMTFVTEQRTKDGRVFPVEVTLNYVEFDGEAYNFASMRDISDRLQAEAALRESEEKYRLLFSNELDAISLFDVETGQLLDVNHAFTELYGYDREEALTLKATDVSAEASQTRAAIQQASASGSKAHIYLRWHRKKDGTIFPVELCVGTFVLQGRQVMCAVARDVTERQRVEAALRDSEAQLKLDIIERQQAEELLWQQSQRERLIADIVQQIRQSLHLDTILSTTVENIRHCLGSDRVTIYRLDGDSRGRFVAESVGSEWPSLLRTTMRQSWLKHYLERYQHGLVSVLVDLQQAEFSPGVIRFLQRCQVQAGLAVPILQGQKLWGLLIVHQCRTPRDWQVHEIDLLQQLAAQVAIAIQQSELFQQVQQLNTVLEDQVQERTAQLAQALNFEARLKRITDKVRDSLDEDHILTTAVQELALGLNVHCCDTGIYNAAHTTSTITHEYSDGSSAIGRTIEMADRPEYQQLLQGQYLQFCICDGLVIRSIQNSSTILACPILDDQGVLGDLWLFHPSTEWFNELEIRLVQQVANHCAIAIRQARLYQAAQAQVAELEKLNRLKDDFLSTVSHELRTPMSSIKMATQMLEMSLIKEGKLAPDPSDRASRYFQVLHDECDREIKLINDLLDLTRLDAETEPLLFTAINPHCWIPSVVEPFLEQARQQEQELQVHLPPDLPTLHTDLDVLARILTELLRNACKYTPSQAAIAVTAQANSEFFWLSVHNTGIEIASVELENVFDKFYRIPNHDPWKHSGTGLGLALVKKLVEHLSGTIQVTSQANQVSFTVQIPIAPPALT
ncbi:MAG TPA: PAS domain S-box protein, partial [Candidatus Obscuribacterales bacterium]